VGAARAESAGSDATHLIRLSDVGGRPVWHLAGSAPACFLLVDERAGGILVNSPVFDPHLAEAIARVAKIRFIFFPSWRGARNVAQWRSACAARTIAAVAEMPAISGPIDEGIDSGVRIHGRLDFLALPGRTRGTCALRSRAEPGIVFFGPALEHADWPLLVRHDDDDSYEDRLIGGLGVRALEFEFAFCDNYSHGLSRFGPGADRAVAAGLAAVLEADNR
jgi:hypothetical protein